MSPAGAMQMKRSSPIPGNRSETVMQGWFLRHMRRRHWFRTSLFGSEQDGERRAARQVRNGEGQDAAVASRAPGRGGQS